MGVGFRASGHHVDALDVAAVEPDRVLDLISGFGFRVSGSKIRGSSLRCRVSDFGSKISGLGFRILNEGFSWFRVRGFRFKD